MASQLFDVTGDQYRTIDRRVREIMRQVDLKGGSPLDPDKVADNLQMILEGRSVILVPRPNIIVRVDRSIRPAYPTWIDKVMDPELETSGPAEYDLAMQVSLWYNDSQEDNLVDYQAIYDYLKNHSMLKSCLGLQDALAIQKLSVVVFQKVFGNKFIYFWKSVVRSGINGSLNVSSLHVDRDKVELSWHSLSSSVHYDEFAVLCH
jgi:hypothetical protein